MSRQRAGRAAPRGAVQRLRRDLGERTKELRCVYAISQIVDAQQDPDRTLQQIADRLPGSWQFPRQTCARIAVEDRSYATRNFRRTGCCLKRRIRVDGAPVGAVEIYRLDRTTRAGGSFLRAEEALLGVVAERLGKIVYRMRAEEMLRAANARLRELFGHEQAVREEERRRIAHEIHDELGQSLSALALDLAWIKRHQAPVAGAPERLASMTAMVDSSLRTARRIAGELRPVLLDDAGLVPAVQWYVGEFGRRAGVRCRLRLAPLPTPPTREAATLAFRVLQELLTNVARHARASRVAVSLSEAGGSLRLAVSDDGVGLAPRRRPRAPSLGLLGVRESVQAAGGAVELHSAPGRGTRVRVSLPARWAREARR